MLNQLSSCSLVLFFISKTVFGWEVINLYERFGVTHPPQIVEYKLKRPIPIGKTELVDEVGEAVPFQVFGKNNLRFYLKGGLPAYSKKVFIFDNQGINPQGSLPNQVTLTTLATEYILSNGLISLKILKTSDLANPLAPIQGVKLLDGTWTGTGPNPLQIWDYPNWKPFPATSLKTTVIEASSIRTTLLVEYTGVRPPLYYGPNLLVPGGNGYYKCKISLEAGQSSAYITEESDFDTKYALNIESNLSPNQARYQGYTASSLQNGYTYNAQGDVIPYDLNRPSLNMDAFVELPFQGTVGAAGRYLTRWDPWSVNTGRYWVFYNKNLNNESNLLGIYQGRVSEVKGGHFSGVEVVSTAETGTELRVRFNRRGPDATVFSINRFSWGLYIGRKGELKNATEVQLINQSMNLYGGINYRKIANQNHTFNDPTGGFQGIYIKKDKIQSLLTKIRTDYPFYIKLYNESTTYRDLWDAMQDPTNAKFNILVSKVKNNAKKILDAFVNRFGIHDKEFEYWFGGLAMHRDSLRLNTILVMSDLSPGILSAADKASMKSIIALYGYLLRDTDFVPLFDGHGLSMGTENMPIQQRGYRDLYTILLSNHPEFSSYITEIETSSLSTLNTIINSSGAEVGSPHYMSASFIPTHDLLQALQTNTNSTVLNGSRVEKFAKFVLQLLTPKEPRFGGKRKLVAFGDGSTEGTDIFGTIGLSLTNYYPELSNNLMSAWKEMGSPTYDFFGTSALKTDYGLSDTKPDLKDEHFSGYFTILRHAYGTPDETAVWLLDGKHYRDHASYDLGGFSTYALGAPLSLMFGSMYYPYVPGSWLRNVVIDESQLNAPWNSTNVSLSNSFGIRNNQEVIGEPSLLVSTDKSKMSATFDMGNSNTWTRTITSYRPSSSEPVIRIQDSFAGPWTNSNKIFSMNQMAEGQVNTPVGIITPSTGSTASTTSGGTIMDLNSGVSQFIFQGSWTNDWDLYVNNESAAQAIVSNWGHYWHPGFEQLEFSQANGKAFEERQHILRVKSNKSFDIVIVPYRKGARPADLNVTTSEHGLILTRNGNPLVLD